MRKTTFNTPGHAHFLTFSCYRRCQVLTDQGACRLLARSIDRARDLHAFDLWAYVFMPDHVHLLIRPRSEDYSMVAILRSIKGPFAKWLLDDWRVRHPERLRRLRVGIGARVRYQVWEHGGGYDRNLYSLDLIRRAVEYIEANPVRKRLVSEPTEWRWSSAAARRGSEDACLRVDEIDWSLPVKGEGSGKPQSKITATRLGDIKAD